MLCLAAGCGKTEDVPPVAAPKKAAPPEAPVSVASAQGRDVVIVVVDGLRGDLLPVSVESAPFMNQLAGEGLYFRRATSNSSHVMQSLSSFFTGRLPTRGGAIGVYEAEPQEQSATMAQAFQGAGYYTGMLANHPAIQGAGYTKGFQEVQVAQAGQPLDDMALVKRAGEFLEDAGDDHVFLYVHFAGVLASRIYQPDPAGDPATAPFSVRDFGKDFKFSAADLRDSPRAQATKDEYLASMKTADAAVKSLVDVLRSSGRLDKTLLLLTSLHGFELFEHLYLGVGWSLDDESVRVPLFLRAPGAVPAVQTKGLATLVDVMPSLLTLVGIAFDPAPLDGQSLFVVDGEQYRYTRMERPRIAELVIPERCVVRSVTTNDWKYIAASAWATPKERYALAESHRETANAIAAGTKKPFPMWGADGRESLIQMPSEHETQIKMYPEVRQEMAAILAEYQKSCEISGLPARSPTVTVKAVDADQVENLESLGYL